MTVELINSHTPCPECSYWTNPKVVALVDFLCRASQYVFKSGAEFLASYPIPVTSIKLSEFLFKELTAENASLYTEELKRLEVLLLQFMDGITKEDATYKDMRAAVVESFVAHFLQNEFTTNYNHHCLVKVDGHLVDNAKTIDVAGWENESKGEFHECKIKAFPYKSEQSKYDFLVALKQKVGTNNLVFVSAFGLAPDSTIESYKANGLTYCDRNGLSEKFF